MIPNAPVRQPIARPPSRDARGRGRADGRLEPRAGPWHSCPPHLPETRRQAFPFAARAGQSRRSNLATRGASRTVADATHHSPWRPRVDILNDARRLATIATVFIALGWVAVIYALVAGAIWWIDLATSDAFNFL